MRSKRLSLLILLAATIFLGCNPFAKKKKNKDSPPPPACVGENCPPPTDNPTDPKTDPETKPEPTPTPKPEPTPSPKPPVTPPPGPGGGGEEEDPIDMGAFQQRIDTLRQDIGSSGLTALSEYGEGLWVIGQDRLTPHDCQIYLAIDEATVSVREVIVCGQGGTLWSQVRISLLYGHSSPDNLQRFLLEPIASSCLTDNGQEQEDLFYPQGSVLVFNEYDQFSPQDGQALTNANIDFTFKLATEIEGGISRYCDDVMANPGIYSHYYNADKTFRACQLALMPINDLFAEGMLGCFDANVAHQNQEMRVHD